MTHPINDRKIPRHLITILLFAITLFSTFVKADIRVEVDRDPIRMNESFQLTFTATETPDSDPDFSPLRENFDILGQSQSSHVSVVNGDVTKEIQWTLNVMPRKEGKLTIPSISFGSESGPTKDITVTSSASDSRDGDSAAPEETFLEAELAPEEAYVQSQMIYTLRILSQYGISGSLLNEPAPENALVTQLGKDRSYTTYRDNQRYQVIERSYAIFPQASGKMIIEPVKLDVEVEVPPTNWRDRLSRFRNQLRRLSTDKIEVPVKPAPADFPGQHWLPAQDLKLQQQWSGDFNQVHVGEPLTRTVTLVAKGVVTSQLPEPDLGTPNTADGSSAADVVKYYPDQPATSEDLKPSGITSYRQEKFAIIATKPGNYTLPAVEIPWWNTTTNQLEIARLAETTLAVLPAAGAQSQQSDKTTTAQQFEGAATESITQGDEPSQRVYSHGIHPAWRWATITLLVIWITTLAWTWRLRHRQSMQETGDQEEASASDSIRTDAHFSERKLEAACRSNQTNEVAKLLVVWAKQQWPTLKINGLQQIAAHCPAALQKEVAALNRTLYGKDNGQEWNAEALLEAFKLFQRETQSNKTKSTSRQVSLKPLYKSS